MKRLLCWGESGDGVLVKKSQGGLRREGRGGGNKSPKGVQEEEDKNKEEEEKGYTRRKLGKRETGGPWQEKKYVWSKRRKNGKRMW